ncbi:MAG: hypothetical protein OEZ05_12980, partial [Nitrospirota bacterium]|nr:hypothetical protein [Nitrospirota bacterium]
DAASKQDEHETFFSSGISPHPSPSSKNRSSLVRQHIPHLLSEMLVVLPGADSVIPNKIRKNL